MSCRENDYALALLLAKVVEVVSLNEDEGSLRAQASELVERFAGPQDTLTQARLKAEIAGRRDRARGVAVGTVYVTKSDDPGVCVTEACIRRRWADLTKSLAACERAARVPAVPKDATKERSEYEKVRERLTASEEEIARLKKVIGEQNEKLFREGENAGAEIARLRTERKGLERQVDQLKNNLSEQIKQYERLNDIRVKERAELLSTRKELKDLVERLGDES